MPVIEFYQRKGLVECIDASHSIDEVHKQTRKVLQRTADGRVDICQQAD